MPRTTQQATTATPNLSKVRFYWSFEGRKTGRGPKCTFTAGHFVLPAVRAMEIEKLRIGGLLLFKARKIDRAPPPKKKQTTPQSISFCLYSSCNGHCFALHWTLPPKADKKTHLAHVAFTINKPIKAICYRRQVVQLSAFVRSLCQSKQKQTEDNDESDQPRALGLDSAVNLHGKLDTDDANSGFHTHDAASKF